MLKRFRSNIKGEKTRKIEKWNREKGVSASKLDDYSIKDLAIRKPRSLLFSLGSVQRLSPILII